MTASTEKEPSKSNQRQHRVWVSTDHATHHGGVASIVVAMDIEEARTALRRELQENGLGTKKSFTLVEIPLDRCHARVLCDGY